MLALILAGSDKSNTVMSASSRLTYPAVGKEISVGNVVVVGNSSVVVNGKLFFHISLSKICWSAVLGSFGYTTCTRLGVLDNNARFNLKSKKLRLALAPYTPRCIAQFS